MRASRKIAWLIGPERAAAGGDPEPPAGPPERGCVPESGTNTHLLCRAGTLRPAAGDASYGRTSPTMGTTAPRVLVLLIEQ
ncbi:hypothetical protein GCM10023320_82560 [Pseudonocardia adelaidensis]|uniref:Uncharacterized protein n=1 Tax=Pseudonocardia adelaidensis TaxID=648754 RepID=A0ABP9PA12_9PSEU